MICNGCGGLLGRDCYNAQECEQIAADMARNERTPDTSAKVDVEHYRDTVRCMSNVLTDLANMLGTRQGEPDDLFDAIEELQEKAALQAPRSDTSAVELVREGVAFAKQIKTEATMRADFKKLQSVNLGFKLTEGAMRAIESDEQEAKLAAEYETKAEQWLKNRGA